MTAATSARALPPILAIMRYTLRITLHGKRWVGIVLPTAAAVLFGLLVPFLDGTPDAKFAEVASIALFALVLPVTCLVVGDSVLGSELRSGSFTFTWLAPIRTWEIIVGRWLAGTIVAAGCLSLSFGLAAAMAGASASVGGAAVAAAFGAMAYLAVFIAIGCVARRAAVWSLAFVFLVERLLGSALAGIAQLSPSWEARAAFIGLVSGPDHMIRDGIPHGADALVRLVLIAAVALALASIRLKRLKLSGSTD